MKVGLTIVVLVVVALGWRVFSNSATIRQQAQQIQELTAALTAKSQQQALALQMDCAGAASRFLLSRGWKASAGSDYYENHFNAKLSRCFVLVSGYLINDDFRTIDLYDAIEGKRYATYNGHNICEAIITNPGKCAMDSGAIWFDGNDSRSPADFTVGFRGLLYGGGKGDENTQKAFIDRVQAFIAQ